MTLSIVFHGVAIAAFLALSLIPFDPSRIRAPWAVRVFVITGLIGIAKGVWGLVQQVQWLVLSDETRRIVDFYSGAASGMILGLISALILSGQLIGTRRDNHTRNEPAI